MFQYIEYVEASIRGYSSWSLGPLITVQNIGYVKASTEGYSTESLGPLITSVLSAK
jgi:hypothetical protein